MTLSFALQIGFLTLSFALQIRFLTLSFALQRKHLSDLSAAVNVMKLMRRNFQNNDFHTLTETTNSVIFGKIGNQTVLEDIFA